MWPVKTFYYSDELHDDFASTSGLRDVKVDKDHITGRSMAWKTGSLFLHRVVATPLVFLYTKICYGLRFENRKALKKIKGGFFIYANHTQYAVDAFLPTLASFPKRGYIITGRQAVSLPVVRGIVKMLGAVPLPSGVRDMKAFFGVIEQHIEKGRTVTVFPEAHIWPYYTGIRPFPADSFLYPVRIGVPAVAVTVTYRRRKILKNRHPLVTVKVSDPFYPDAALPPKEARNQMRDEVYEFMKHAAESANQPEYYRYIKSEQQRDLP